jgi:DNA-binding NarL/FixJ family response regulator
MDDTSVAGLRVAIVDEHEVVRAGLSSWLDAQAPQLSPVGGFARAAELLTWLPGTPGLDVVVAEIRENGHAPDLDGLRGLCAAVPAVIVHSAVNSDEVILSSLDAGAATYVSKADGRDHLLEALRSVGNGDGYVPPRMAAALHRSLSMGRLALSDRERQVLVAWFTTESKDHVGNLLQIAPATVRTHLQRVRAKYASVGRPAPTKSALLARAIEDGIIGLSDLGSNGQAEG